MISRSCIASFQGSARTLKSRLIRNLVLSNGTTSLELVGSITRLRSGSLTVAMGLASEQRVSETMMGISLLEFLEDVPRLPAQICLTLDLSADGELHTGGVIRVL